MKTYSKIQISSSFGKSIVETPGSCSHLGVKNHRGGAVAPFRWGVFSPVHHSLRLSHHIGLPITSLPCLDPPEQLPTNFQTIICLRLVNHQPKEQQMDLYWSSIIKTLGSQQGAKRQEVWPFKIINKSILPMAFKGNKPRQENFIFVTKNGAKKRVQKPLFKTPFSNRLDCWAHEDLEMSHY